MKRFLLTTEYTEAELQAQIENSIRIVIQQELPKIIQKFINSPPAKEDKLLSRKELRLMLGLSYPTIIQLTRSGVLKAKIIGGQYKYLKSQVLNSFKDTGINKKKYKNEE